jgi:hypothetical protein
MKEYKTPAGEFLIPALSNALSLRDQSKEPVRFTYSEVVIEISLEDTMDTAYEKWHKGFEQDKLAAALRRNKL